MALAASQMVAEHTGELLLSSQNCDRLFRTKTQKASLFKNDVLNLQVGVLGILNNGLMHRCTRVWSDKTIGSIQQVWTECKKFLGIKKV